MKEAGDMVFFRYSPKKLSAYLCKKVGTINS